MHVNREFVELLRLASGVRSDILRMIQRAGSGHPGGALSIADILVVLYRKVMHHDPANPTMESRDRLILSKGHAAPALYSILARCGYFDRELLKTFREIGSPLQGHPDCRKLRGIEISTGSLGQGLSVAGGIALGQRIRGNSARVFVLLGDGEIQEGQVWEAAMAISHYGLNRVIAIIDNNGLQIDGAVRDVMNVDPIHEKFRAFGWNVLSIDGHDLRQIEEAFSLASESKRPTAVVARTVKGKGVDFLENTVASHHLANMSQEKLEAALASVSRQLEEACAHAE